MSKAIKTLLVASAAAAIAAPLAQADAYKAPQDAFRGNDVQRLHDAFRLVDVQRLHDAYRLHDAFRMRDVQRLHGSSWSGPALTFGLPWDGLR